MIQSNSGPLFRNICRAALSHDKFTKSGKFNHMAPKYQADQMLWQSYLSFSFQYCFLIAEGLFVVFFFFPKISNFHRSKPTVMQSKHFLKRLVESATIKTNLDIVFNHPPLCTSRKSQIRSFFCRPAKSGTKSLQPYLVCG